MKNGPVLKSFQSLGISATRLKLLASASSFTISGGVVRYKETVNCGLDSAAMPRL